MDKVGEVDARIYATDETDKRIFGCKRNLVSMLMNDVTGVVLSSDGCEFVVGGRVDLVTDWRRETESGEGGQTPF